MSIFEQIKDAIITGEFKPGERLTEEALAKQYNVSRTPIREAIKQLEKEGLVTPYQRRGIMVRKFSTKDVIQIYNLRALLESYGAGQAALNRTEENIEKLILINQDYKNAINCHDPANLKSVRKIQETNQLFHNEIFKAAKNEHLKELISKVVLVPLIFQSFYSFTEQQLFRSLNMHEIIIEAIHSKDIDRAKTAMKEHIYQGRDDAIKQIIAYNNGNV